MSRSAAAVLRSPQNDRVIVEAICSDYPDFRDACRRELRVPCYAGAAMEARRRVELRIVAKGADDGAPRHDG
jgi:hypothetical protein